MVVSLKKQKNDIGLDCQSGPRDSIPVMNDRISFLKGKKSNLLVDKVSDESRRGHTFGFVVSLEASLEIDDQPLQQQLADVGELELMIETWEKVINMITYLIVLLV